MRDYVIEEINRSFDLPITAAKSESGFFVLLDISKCLDIIPKRYLASHDYEDLKEGETPVSKLIVHMDDGRVPYDVAFCRWMAVERGVILFATSSFYNKKSPFRIDTLVRLSICKGMEHTVKAV